ncbi:unnamed protein product [Ectocarpus sp. CCAP 1310/34]|nr:unnamed protein product [Ectocarpus sp. CCAP 1310/34]
MDLLLDVFGPVVLQRQPVAADGRAATADGYIPRGGGRHNTTTRSTHRGESDHSSESLRPVLLEATLRLAVFVGCVYTSVRLTQFLGKLKQREDQAATRIFLKAKLPSRVDIEMDRLHFNAHEMAVAQDVVASSDLETTFDMIGGLGDLKDEIMDIVTLACSREAQLQGVGAPRGILFSGVPGTGKTMLARAIAKESGATFINVRMGAVQQKWVGEGEKMVSAIFSLANKLAPSIIFIDEIDCFMRTRNVVEQDHVVRVKTEFMTLWDGLLTERSRPVIVLGTTNRPLDIDPAILRRLPRQFVVGLPETADQREQILQLIARRYRLAEGVDLGWVAAQTEGFSGSDLDALFQAAQTVPAREFARALRENARQERAQAQARANAAAAAAEAEEAAARREHSSRTRPAANLDAAAVLRETVVDLSRRTMGAARNVGRMAAAAAEGHPQGDAILRAILGPARPSAEEGGDTRPALQMRGISQDDFRAALDNVRPTGKWREAAVAFAAARMAAAAAGRAEQRRTQE